MAAPFPSPTSTWHSNTYPSLAPSRPELSAKGKTVLITGGGTGIGAETARYFAQAGATRIAILGRREQPLLDTKTSIERDHSELIPEARRQAGYPGPWCCCRRASGISSECRQ
jgi:hypothetical protein